MVTQEKQSTEEETNKERKLAEVQLPEWKGDASLRAKYLESAFAFHTRHVEWGSQGMPEENIGLITMWEEHEAGPP